jgi:hypothetical protein
MTITLFREGAVARAKPAPQPPPRQEYNCHFERSEKSLSLKYVQRLKTKEYFLAGGFCEYVIDFGAKAHKGVGVFSSRHKWRG